MSSSGNISIVPTSDEHVPGYNRCVAAVARERRFIGLVEGPSLAQSQEFVRNLLSGGGVQFVALDQSGDVVGWCDIFRPRLEGFRHCGRLGMGLLPAVRGHGVGRRLAEAAIRAASDQGIERIELEVFTSNTLAIALYESLGFVREGVKRGARKLDGRYDDHVLMALMTSPQSGAAGDPGAITVATLKAFLDAFNAHDLDAIMEFFSDDCEFYMPRGPEPWGTRYVGKARVREGLATRFTGIPDVHYGDDNHWVAGNLGVSTWMLTGTTKTGEPIRVRGVDLLEFRDGKVIRKDSYWKIVEK